jgi:hypothetical protein
MAVSETGEDSREAVNAMEATVLYNGKPYHILYNGRFWDCWPEDSEIVAQLVAEHKITSVGGNNYVSISVIPNFLPNGESVHIAEEEFGKSEN